MKREDAEEFTQALGQVAVGLWRQIVLADKLGVPKALGLSLAEWREQRFNGYRLGTEERKAAVLELKAEEAAYSNRKVAELLGVDEGTVRGDLRAENSAPALSSSPATEAEPAESSAPDSAAVIARREAEKLAEQERAVVDCFRDVVSRLQSFSNDDFIARARGIGQGRFLAVLREPDLRKQLALISKGYAVVASFIAEGITDVETQTRFAVDRNPGTDQAEATHQ